MVRGASFSEAAHVKRRDKRLNRQIVESLGQAAPSISHRGRQIIVMKDVFRDRTEAGRLLGEALVAYAGQQDLVVLGLPRGGVPVAFEVANRLRAPLDVFVVRKLGVPGHEEYAFGAIASGGVCFFDEEVVSELRIPQALIDRIVAREERELQRRELAYRGHAAPAPIHGKIALLIDDGIATGSTMVAAVRAVRLSQPKRLIVAVPTAPPSSCDRLAREADEVVALIKAEDFVAVGQWYLDFSQTSDDEVRRLLAEVEHQQARVA